MKILIATPAHGGMITTRYLASFIETTGTVNGKGHRISWTSIEDGNVGQARNKAADIALENKFDKLLFIDSDVVWKAEQVMMLLESDKEIVGGTYPNRGFPIRLVFNALPDERDLFQDTKRTVQDFLNFKNKYAGQNGEVEIAHLPTGFMLIDVNVFRKMKATTPKYKSRDSATQELKILHDFFPFRLVQPVDSEVCMYETEDWGFCTEARRLGIKVYLQTKCIVDHIGQQRFSVFGGKQSD
jgi:hypothetical protein